MRIKSVEEFNELATNYPALHAQFKQLVADENWIESEPLRKLLNKQFEAMKTFRRAYDYPRRCFGNEVFETPLPVRN